MSSAIPPIATSGGDRIINLLVGGVSYMTLKETLCAEDNSVFSKHFESRASPQQPGTALQELSNGTVFIDRDGNLFRFILDYLRSGKLILPDSFSETARLHEEAKFYGLTGLMKLIKPSNGSKAERKDSRSGTPAADSKKKPAAATSKPVSEARGKRESSESASDSGDLGVEGGNILIGYRGTFAFGRDGQADVKFRKLTRILVCGKSSLCREVFGETLNESRDPDRTGENRYTARLYLKHNSLENAFDMLTEKGFRMIGSAGSGASCTSVLQTTGGGSSDVNVPRAGTDNEEARWNHYNEFIFFREQR